MIYSNWETKSQWKEKFSLALDILMSKFTVLLMKPFVGIKRNNKYQLETDRL